MATKTSETTRDRLNRDLYIYLNLTSSVLGADIERLCQKVELTEAHFRVLWVLCRMTGPQGRQMGEVADGLINRAADVTRLMDKLETLGMVSRERASDDRRRVMVSATTHGKKVFEKLAAGIRHLHDEQWSELTMSEQRQLIALLKKVLMSRTPVKMEASWLLQGGKND